jgi:hypothetical protein
VLASELRQWPLSLRTPAGWDTNCCRDRHPAAAQLPELWATDFEVVAETRVSFPAAPAPMGRVPSLDGLTGMPVGKARVTIQIVDDPFLSGCYELDARQAPLRFGPERHEPTRPLPLRGCQPWSTERLTPMTSSFAASARRKPGMRRFFANCSRAACPTCSRGSDGRQGTDRAVKQYDAAL